MSGYQVNGIAIAEFRFKRDWETRRAGWVQGKSEVSDGWHPLKYCRSIKAADRYVRKVMARRAEPIAYINLPIEKVIK